MFTNKTRELFTGLIERPPLTDQLLQRPPFRFLHDVVNAVIQNTGFLTNTFTNEELDASNITDKNAKLNFIKKLIKALNDDGSLNDVRAAKIVAGKEPELTNLLLQKLAFDAAAFHGLQTNNSAKEENTKREKKVHKKERSNNKDDEKRRSHDQDREVSRERRNLNRKKEKKKKKENSNELMTVKQAVENDVRRISIDEGHFEDAELETPPAKVNKAVHTQQEPSGTGKTEDSGIADDMTCDGEQLPVVQTAKEQQRPSTSSGRPRTSAGRPGTAAARPAPPKLKKKQLAEVERKSETEIKTTAVIVDERRENGEEFIFEVEPMYEQTSQTDAGELITAEHGGLVRKILETRNDLKEKMNKETYNPNISVFDEKETKKSQEEIVNLQKIMQRITQTMLPLVRLFDNIQEDANNMSKEIEEWRTENRENENDLRERRANAEGTSESLLLRLNQLDEQIKEVKSALIQSKAAAIASEERIQALVKNI